MRAFHANGHLDKMAVPWAVEGLPTPLHLSLFLWLTGHFPGRRGRGSLYLCHGVLVDRALFDVRIDYTDAVNSA